MTAAVVSETAQQCYSCKKAVEESARSTCPECSITACVACLAVGYPCGYFDRVCYHCGSKSCKRRYLPVYGSPGIQREVSLCAAGSCYDEFAKSHVAELCALDEALAAYVNSLKDNQSDAEFHEHSGRIFAYPYG